MIFLFFLILWLVLMTGCSPLFLPSDINRFYKSKGILPDPVQNNPSLAESIASGSQMAMDHCQMIFKWEKWNCPPSTFSRQTTQLPTKETAYAKAISSAGVVYAVTKSCSKGDIKGCGCDPNASGPSTAISRNWVNLRSDPFFGKNTREIDWSWGGCSDDPKFALSIAKKLLDGLEKGSNAAERVGRHNNRVGREIVRDTMVTKCRCHGASGSCSLQTCWLQLASFNEITRKLKQKYRQAVRVTYENVKDTVILGNSARAETDTETHFPVDKKGLIFLESSPDYCVRNLENDLPGTKGRTCTRKNSSWVEKRSCRNLCRSCGHKVRRMKREVTKECNCRFSWCCKVTCETCVETEENYFCG